MRSTVLVILPVPLIPRPPELRKPPPESPEELEISKRMAPFEMLDFGDFSFRQGMWDYWSIDAEALPITASPSEIVCPDVLHDWTWTTYTSHDDVVCDMPFICNLADPPGQCRVRILKESTEEWRERFVERFIEPRKAERGERWKLVLVNFHA